MGRATCAMLLVLGFCLNLLAQEPPASIMPHSTLRVATWNLLNLFDNIDDPGHADEGTDPKSLADLKVMASVVDAMNADVLGVQEVENRRILQQFNRCLISPYPYVELLEGNDPRGIDVALLSRFPITKSSSHRLRDIGNGRHFSRDFPVFRVRVNEQTAIHFGVVHLKSKRGKKASSDAQRKAEATAVAGVVASTQSLHPKIPFVVMGDFNDFPVADTLSPLFDVMADAMALLPVEQRVSYIYNNKGQQIDLVMHTKNLKVKTARFLNPPHNPSDHRPGLVEFEVPGALVRPAAARGRRFPKHEKIEINATDLPQLEMHDFQEAFVTGRVVKVHRPKGGYSVSLNFHENYRSACTAYIPADALSRLPDMDGLVGRTVTLIGPICKRRGAFQVRITNASQLLVHQEIEK